MAEPQQLRLADMAAMVDDIQSEDGPGEVTQSFNDTLIADFRASAGEMTGDLQGGRILLLTTTGARSGQRRTVPLAYIRHDQRIFVIASRGGTDVHPAWFHNLVAHPRVTVERGAETYEADAVVLDEPERSEVYAAAARKISNFADYERRTDRVIPVVELRPA
jgi:deazaflavin-dependent oxidoreductase (nitroreductase family)